MATQQGQVWEGRVQLLCHGHVGQQHELLDQPVAVPVLVQPVTLQLEKTSN